MIQTGWFKAIEPDGSKLEILLSYDLDAFIEAVASAEIKTGVKIILDEDGRRLVENEKKSRAK